MKRSTELSQRRSRPRQNVEKRPWETKAEATDGLRGKSMGQQSLIHELEVHQIELEMQNDELRRTQADAEVSRARYAELFDFAPVGYLTLDAGGLILDVNLAGAQLLGWARASLAGKSFLGFLEAECRQLFSRFLLEVLSSPDKRSCELRLVGGSQRPSEVRADAILQPQREGSGSRVQMSLADVTERKRVEREREELVKELEASLASVKRLSGMLPICASCKRIRTDTGYWQQVDQYIREHSEADFSHGLCPACADTLYPEYRQ